jgi:hypothetical protein
VCLVAAASCAVDDFDRFRVPTDLRGADLALGHDLSGLDLATASTDLAAGPDLSTLPDLTPGPDLATACGVPGACVPTSTATCVQCGSKTCGPDCRYGPCTPNSSNCQCLPVSATCCYAVCADVGAACTTGSQCCSGICDGTGHCVCGPMGTMVNYSAVVQHSATCCSGSSGSTLVDCVFSCL